MTDPQTPTPEATGDTPEQEGQPRGELATRTLAMPADTNPSGDIFGGWLMSQMDIAGGTAAEWRARGRVATVAVEGMEFHAPVKVGDVVCCYADILKVGKTSMTILIEAWVLRRRDAHHRVKVTEGRYTFVALDEQRNKRPIP
ncbi:MAG: acyl-CoA thioesterase [Rhodobacterales bacterium]|nr:acyl-CoA thioesterase [Rhodobacterales bacterium]